MPIIENTLNQSQWGRSHFLIEVDENQVLNSYTVVRG